MITKTASLRQGLRTIDSPTLRDAIDTLTRLAKQAAEWDELAEDVDESQFRPLIDAVGELNAAIDGAIGEHDETEITVDIGEPRAFEWNNVANAILIDRRSGRALVRCSRNQFVIVPASCIAELA